MNDKGLLSKLHCHSKRELAAFSLRQAELCQGQSGHKAAATGRHHFLTTPYALSCCLIAYFSLPIVLAGDKVSNKIYNVRPIDDTQPEMVSLNVGKRIILRYIRR